MVEAGGWGLYVPHGLTWELEKADPPKEAEKFRQIDSLKEVTTIIEGIGVS